MAYGCIKIFMVILFSVLGILTAVGIINLFRTRALSEHVETKFLNYDTHAHRTFTGLAQDMYVSLSRSLESLRVLIQKYIDEVEVYKLAPPKNNTEKPRVTINITTRDGPAKRL